MIKSRPFNQYNESMWPIYGCNVDNNHMVRMYVISWCVHYLAISGATCTVGGWCVWKIWVVDPKPHWLMALGLVATLSQGSFLS
jgi:hypothetical protein